MSIVPWRRCQGRSLRRCQCVLVNFLWVRLPVRTTCIAIAADFRVERYPEPTKIRGATSMNAEDPEEDGCS
ncbi:hypothetical protein BJV77DRAFT_1000831 [Russula vinacea]|nr:hypothetical protein BJV77DRAFT_1000831 [Russula vinacea]